jgi:hypothetical protein
MKSKYYLNIYAKRAGCYLLLLLGLMAAENIAAQGLVEISPGITTEISGGIHIESNGHWHSEGIMIPGSSTLIMQGMHPQSLRQDGGAYHNLKIDKSGGEVVLAGQINVNGGLFDIVSGDLLLNGFVVTLDPTATLNEAPGQTIKGLTGYVQTIRSISSPAGENIAGMGLVLASTDDFGITEIIRSHEAVSSNGHSGILRYFDVVPTLEIVSDASVRFYYDESELNGNDEASLKFYHSPDEGLNWIEVIGVLNMGSNFFEASGIVPSGRFTLSSECLETCIATVARTHPATVYLNTAGLGALEPADIDNGSSGACGIDSMTVTPEAFTCLDEGFQWVILTVTDQNGCTNSSSVLVEIIDTLPPSMVCRNITVSVGSSCQAMITPGDIDNGSYDACNLSLSIDRDLFTCEDIGSDIMVMLTASDAFGNVAQCEAMVTVEAEVTISCGNSLIEMGDAAFVTIDPMDLIDGDPDDYIGYALSVEPDILYCNELGAHTIMLTITDPSGNVSTCESIITLNGPDTDCDGVADQCDFCAGGDDLLDSDNDGIPDCADWDGWEYLVEEWQCANNKVFLCHGGNVICVNQNAVQAHLDHGDFMGSCNAVICDEPAALQITDKGKNVLASKVEPVGNPLDKKDDILKAHDPGTILAKNMPNPFFPETTIRFYLPEENRIRLTVFDMMGVPVGQLADGVFEEGWHEVIFDGTDHADGMYFYVLETMSQYKAGVMILVR